MNWMLVELADDPLSKIIEKLREGKVADLKEDLEKLKKNEGLKPIDLDEKLRQEQQEKKIKTGTLIDEIIGGGLEPRTSMLLWGEFGSGKTQTCLTMCVECPYAVIYIDSEGSFRAQRLKEICEARGKDWNEIKKKVILFGPQNWIEQMMILNKLPAPTDVPTGKIGLIILDSLTKLFRGIEFSGRQSLQLKQPLIREFILQLEKIIKAYDAALIFTTQIYESPTSNPFLPDWTGQKPVGGSSILHQPDFVIFLRKQGQTNVRIARMLDSSWQPLRERAFVINKRGIDDIPEEAKIRETLTTKAEKFEKTQSQETIHKSKRKKKKSTEEEAEEILSINPEGEEE